VLTLATKKKGELDVVQLGDVAFVPMVERRRKSGDRNKTNIQLRIADFGL